MSARPLDEAALRAAVAGWMLSPPEAIAGWSEADWRAAKALVLMHGIAPLLGARGVEPFSAAPAWFRGYLSEQYTLNQARIARLRAEAETIRAAASAAGLGAVALKGAALFAREEVPLDERPMSDLDYLVDASQLACFRAVLEGLDYRLSEETPRHLEFTCQRYSTEVVSREGEHPDNPIRVEVHTWVGQVLLSSVRVDITEAMREAGEAPRALMLHLALHAGANLAKRRIRLVQLRDLTLLAAALGEEDWGWVVRKSHVCGADTLVFSALRLAQRFAGFAWPQALANKQLPTDLDHLLEASPLEYFTRAAGAPDFDWELHWISEPVSRRWLRLRRALPLHRLAMDPVKLRERYGVPHGAPLGSVYALHLARAVAWPGILLWRMLRGRA